MRVFFDVDTQNDFILAGGALAVPGAEALVPALALLTGFARRENIMIFGSVDRHFGSPELRDREGELKRWGGPFPDHCMDGTEGQKKVPSTAPRNPLWIPNTAVALREIAGKAWAHAGEVYFEKQSYDVFHNPNTAEVLRTAEEAVVYGVATDYCVRAAVLGLRKLGVRVAVVRDAIAAVEVNPGDGTRALKDMEDAGAVFISAEGAVKTG
jgi:nicotinamidase/pyrazinamidase